MQPPTPEPSSVDTAIQDLVDGESAVSPAAFLASDRRALSVSGLYSWWVDVPGALDLTRGLSDPIRSGLIYAGLAGATRWPSGKRSTNTLWSRIAGMHLTGRHEFSTFRRTLGSILAAADRRDGIDEEPLSVWMSQHLAVRAVVSPDADVLGHLEREVLRRIDPPLNLMGMPTTQSGPGCASFAARTLGGSDLTSIRRVTLMSTAVQDRESRRAAAT